VPEFIVPEDPSPEIEADPDNRSVAPLTCPEHPKLPVAETVLILQQLMFLRKMEMMTKYLELFFPPLETIMAPLLNAVELFKPPFAIGNTRNITGTC